MSVLLDRSKGIRMEGYSRLMGVQCPEVRTTDLSEKRKGLLAKRYTETWFSDTLSGHLHGQDTNSDAFYAYSSEDDKYGRWMSHIECIRGHCLNDALIASNNAISYLGPTGLTQEEKF